MSDESGKKKSSLWKILRNTAIAVVAVVTIFGMGSQGSSGGLSPRYFWEMYRIDGVDYYLTSETFLWRFQWYELWQYEGEEETLVHRFPLEVHPKYSEEQEAFFYMKGRTIYRWDLATESTSKVYKMQAAPLWKGVEEFFLTRNYTLRTASEKYILLQRSDGLQLLVGLTADGQALKETALEGMLGYGVRAFLEDYVVFTKGDDSMPVVSVQSGQVVDTLDFSGDPVEQQDGTGNHSGYSVERQDSSGNHSGYSVEGQDSSGNQMLFTVSNHAQADLLYLYDASSGELTLLNPEDEGAAAASYDILEARFAWGEVVYLQQEADQAERKVYRIGMDGALVTVSDLPACEEIRAFVVGEDYLICVGTTRTTGLESWQQVLNYYQITQEGEVNLLYQWQAVSTHVLNDCHVICDGDLVISGCEGEAERIRFTVE